MNATNKQFAELDIEGFDFERYILGTYAKKDEVWKRPLTAMKQDIWEQLVVSVSAILSCRPFFILIFLPYIKMNHYGFSRKSIWKNLETFP